LTACIRRRFCCDAIVVIRERAESGLLCRKKGHFIHAESILPVAAGDGGVPEDGRLMRGQICVEARAKVRLELP